MARLLTSAGQPALCRRPGRPIRNGHHKGREGVAAPCSSTTSWPPRPRLPARCRHDAVAPDSDTGRLAEAEKDYTEALAVDREGLGVVLLGVGEAAGVAVKDAEIVQRLGDIGPVGPGVAGGQLVVELQGSCPPLLCLCVVPFLIGKTTVSHRHSAGCPADTEKPCHNPPSPRHAKLQLQDRGAIKIILRGAINIPFIRRDQPVIDFARFV